MADISQFLEDGKFTIWSYYAFKMDEDLHFLNLRREHDIKHKTIIVQKISELYQDPANLPHLKEALASLRSARDSDEPYSTTQMKRVSQAVLFHSDPKLYDKVKSEFPSPEEVQQLKLQVPLLSLIDITPTITSTQRSKLHCPFHQEKTPSFTIYHQSNSYHCFGCQEGGDNIKFVTKLKNLSFLEAINHLRRYA